MLSDEGRKREIARRAKAGAAEIPKSRSDETIVAMEALADSLYLFSQYSIFRVRTADDIDPEVTRENVPWAINPYLSIGTKNALIAASFGVLRELDRIGLSKDFKDEVHTYLMEFAVSAAELEYARTIYREEVRAIQERKGPPRVVQSAMQLPRVSSFEISFSIFFASAKRAVGKLLGLLEWAAGFPVKNGHMIDKFCNRVRQKKKLTDHHHLMDRLKGFENSVNLLNEIRNAFEHPSRDRSVLLTNIDLMSSGALRWPTFTLVHDEIDLPPNQDYGSHIDAVIDLISRLAEQATLISVAMKANSTLGWEAVVKPASDLDPDYPVRWAVNISLPQDLLDKIAKPK